MGLRARLAGTSGRRPVVIAIAGVAVAAVVAGSVVAIVRTATSSTDKAPTPASLGVTTGGPDRPLAAAAVATFNSLMQIPVRQPAECTNLSQQYHVVGPHIWLFRTQISAVLKSSDSTDVQAVEATLNASHDVAFWLYEPPSAVLAEVQRTATCSAALPKAAVPATFRVALTSKDQEPADSLAAALRRIPAVASMSCSSCTQPFVQSTPSPGSMSP